MSYYKTLGISDKATPAEIKAAYRKLALIYHPDKQGDPVKFKELNNAYTTLSDPERRANYDCFGDMPPDFDEQNNTYVVKITLTLEQIYLGYIHHQKIMSKSICPDCILFMETCAECSGSGNVVQMMNIGPFMQQIRAKCKSCFSGQKKKEDKENNCKKCAGTCFCCYTKTIDIKFQPGCLDLTKRIQVGDYSYIINATIAPHDVYTIINSQLHCSLSINLGESLTETYQKTLTFLDGSSIYIAPTWIIEPGDQYIIRGKGLTKRTNLIVKFNVVFPEKFTEKRKEYLKKIFGITTSNARPEESVQLFKYNGITDNEDHDFNGMPGGMPGGIHGMPGGMPGGVHVQNCAQQ